MRARGAVKPRPYKRLFLLALVWKPTPTPPRMKPEPNDDEPGVPGFRSWRGVYVFVFLCFVAVVVVLTVFTHHFG